MTRWDVCNQHLKKFNPAFTRFLEIGVGSGRGGALVHAATKHGIEPHPRMSYSGYSRVFQMTSDEFFARPQISKYDVILVDGLHEAGQVERDIQNAVCALSTGGLIVVHDCNPRTEVAQRVPREQVHWNGDGWKAIVKLRATQPYWEVKTLDTDEGLGLIRHTDVKQSLIELPKRLTWSGLVAHRAEWLGLEAVR